MKAPAPYGLQPWHQTQWDWRAAGNFVCGGAGAGLLAFGVVSGIAGAAFVVVTLAGLALVGLGLLCVWLEIGRPLRALHVFFNPRLSWMTREAMVAALLFPLGLAALFVPPLKWGVLVLALAFVYCQSRILQAAKGIPAWREPLLVPLVVLTGLAEGGGLFLVAQPGHALAAPALLVLCAALVVARQAVWVAYRRRVDRVAARGAIAALDGAGRVLWRFGLWPVLAAALPLVGAVTGAAALVAAAGAVGAFAGAALKYTLVTRAGFNQGFALAHLPVRGVPRHQET